MTRTIAGLTLVALLASACNRESKTGIEASGTLEATEADLGFQVPGRIDSIMPIVLRAISYVIPARYFVNITRGIFLKGVGLEVLWPEAVGLAIYALVTVTLAIRAFRKEIG